VIVTGPGYDPLAVVLVGVLLRGQAVWIALRRRGRPAARWSGPCAATSGGGAGPVGQRSAVAEVAEAAEAAEAAALGAGASQRAMLRT
jgi:hypothetical protein